MRHNQVNILLELPVLWQRIGGGYDCLPKLTQHRATCPLNPRGSALFVWIINFFTSHQELMSQRDHKEIIEMKHQISLEVGILFVSLRYFSNLHDNLPTAPWFEMLHVNNYMWRDDGSTDKNRTDSDPSQYLYSITENKHTFHFSRVCWSCSCKF